MTFNEFHGHFLTREEAAAVSHRSPSVLAKHPDRVIRRAVWGMLPKTRLGRSQYGKLKVYAGESHPHEAQQPVAHVVR